ncbi:hypothetical protein JCM11491_002298 [Sporobolomyces phaffii]
MPNKAHAAHAHKKSKQSAKDKAKAKARSIVDKGKQYFPSSSSPASHAAAKGESTFVEHAPDDRPSTYPQTFYNDDLGVEPLHAPRPGLGTARVPSEHGSGLVTTTATSSRRSSFIGRLMADEDEYHADYRSDLGDEFYAGGEEGDVDAAARTSLDHLPINRYDGLVYVTDGSPSPTSSFSSRSSSSSGGMEDEAEERRRRQTTMGNSETSWEDASPATSASQGLYSPPPKVSKLEPAQLPEYRYAPVTASFSYAGPSYDPHLAPSSTLASTDPSSSFHYTHHHHHQHHHYDAYHSSLVETSIQSAAPSPAISPSNSGASTPRGRNPHPRLLWRSILSSEVIDALDQHHRKIAGCPLPRIESEPTATSPGLSTLDVGPEREGTGKLDVEVRERDKERERVRMGKNRRPLSREGRRWSRAVEKWGL